MEAADKQSDRIVPDDRASQMEAIVAEFETPLLRYAARIAGSASYAEDVVQNTFVKLFRNWKKGTRPTARLKAWLYRVVHNEAVDLVRRESRLSLLHARHAEQKAAECPDGHNCPDRAADRLQVVFQCIQKLPALERQVLLLRIEEGLSYREISDVTGRTEGNIGCILHNAVKTLAARAKILGNTVMNGSSPVGD
jgi:RNA polymerase sigma-70 factor (ECF subfamily)